MVGEPCKTATSGGLIDELFLLAPACCLCSCLPLVLLELYVLASAGRLCPCLPSVLLLSVCTFCDAADLLALSGCSCTPSASACAFIAANTIPIRPPPPTWWLALSHLRARPSQPGLALVSLTVAARP